MPSHLRLESSDVKGKEGYWGGKENLAGPGQRKGVLHVRGCGRDTEINLPKRLHRKNLQRETTITLRATGISINSGLRKGWEVPPWRAYRYIEWAMVAFLQKGEKRDSRRSRALHQTAIIVRVAV